eukprot:c19451_g1_i2.p1 GENE.c19451_g1_i2~~c19451_g1_i2.p1  ORF type:complete len:886 (+),score=158.27 c19451_g1_i2:32-2689(+)
MKKDNEARLKVASELVETERSYVSNLSLVVELFLSPLQKQMRSRNPIANAVVVENLFGNIDVILALSSSFLSELNKLSLPNGIGEVLVKFFHFFRTYIPFVNNYETMSSTLSRKLSTSSRFLRFVRTAEANPRCKGLLLSALLIAPVQRIPRYRLLVQELVRYTPVNHSEGESLRNALVLIEAVATQVNQAVERQEGHLKLWQIQQRLSRPITLVEPNRSFVLNAKMLKVCRKGPRIYEFVLVSDAIMYGREVLPSRRLRLSNFLFLRDVRVVLGTVSPTSFQVLHPHKSFEVIADSPKQRNEWVNAIQNARDHNAPEFRTIDDSAYFAPVWVADKCAPVCSLCQVGWTLTRRRHHCRRCGRVMCDTCSEFALLPCLKNVARKSHKRQRASSLVPSHAQSPISQSSASSVSAPVPASPIPLPVAISRVKLVGTKGSSDTSSVGVFVKNRRVCCDCGDRMRGGEGVTRQEAKSQTELDPLDQSSTARMSTDRDKDENTSNDEFDTSTTDARSSMDIPQSQIRQITRNEQDDQQTNNREGEHDDESDSFENIPDDSRASNESVQAAVTVHDQSRHRQAQQCRSMDELIAMMQSLVKHHPDDLALSDDLALLVRSKESFQPTVRPVARAPATNRSRVGLMDPNSSNANSRGKRRESRGGLVMSGEGIPGGELSAWAGQLHACVIVGVPIQLMHPHLGTIHRACLLEVTWLSDPTVVSMAYVQWYRLESNSIDLVPIPGATEVQYAPTADDHNATLVVEVTPIHSDGSLGIPVRARERVRMEAKLRRRVEGVKTGQLEFRSQVTNARDQYSVVATANKFAIEKLNGGEIVLSHATCTGVTIPLMDRFGFCFEFENSVLYFTAASPEIREALVVVLRHVLSAKSGTGEIL